MSDKNRITALYIRVSTDAQAEEGYSIEAQKEMLKGYCKSKQIENFEFFIDGGFSGSNIMRPELERLIKLIKSNKIKAVVVYKLDRLSRSQKDTLFLIEDVLNPNNTEFVSLNENLDTSTSIGRAMLGIMSAFAQLERETIKERTRMGMRKRVESGLWMGGGKVPFGFDYDKLSGKLVPNVDKDKVMKIYDMYIKGYSPGVIAKTLGFKYDQLIIQILKRKSNYGSIIYKGEEIENCHEAIISKETYLKAQEEMKKRSKIKTPTTKYLLTGLMVCGVCGAKLRYQKWGKNKTRIVCYSKEKSKDYLVKDENCTLPKFYDYEIEESVLKTIFAVNTDKIESSSTKTQSYINILNESYGNECRKLKRLYDLYSRSEDDILLTSINETKERISQLNEKIKQEEYQEKRTKEKENILTKINTVQGMWDYLNISEKQQFIRSVVEKVIVYASKIEVIFKV